MFCRCLDHSNDAQGNIKRKHSGTKDAQGNSKHSGTNDAQGNSSMQLLGTILFRRI